MWYFCKHPILTVGKRWVNRNHLPDWFLMASVPATEVLLRPICSNTNGISSSGSIGNNNDGGVHSSNGRTSVGGSSTNDSKNSSTRIISGSSTTGVRNRITRTFCFIFQLTFANFFGPWWPLYVPLCSSCNLRSFRSHAVLALVTLFFYLLIYPTASKLPRENGFFHCSPPFRDFWYFKTTPMLVFSRGKLVKTLQSNWQHPLILAAI